MRSIGQINIQNYLKMKTFGIKVIYSDGFAIEQMTLAKDMKDQICLLKLMTIGIMESF